jgi:predicted HAD superfamily Cof-like phosphohydrolase
MNNKNVNIIKEIKRFQTDRLLDKQKYEWLNETANIVEELLEARGYSVPKEKREKFKEMLEKKFTEIVNELGLKKENEDEEVDAFADIIVFSIGAILKLGYEPECVLNEVQKEINSRHGVIIDGKFQKDLSKKHLWYKADYTKCLRK